MSKLKIIWLNEQIGFHFETEIPKIAVKINFLRLRLGTSWFYSRLKHESIRFLNATIRPVFERAICV